MRVRDWFNCGMVNKAESSSFKIPQTAGLQSDTFLTFSGVVRLVEVGGAKDPRREMATLASGDVYHFVTTTVNTLI